MEIEFEDKFVRTKNAVRIIQFVNECVVKREWAAVIGDPGTGKSEIRKELMLFFAHYPEKYVPIEMPVFLSSQLRIGGLMKTMIESINPDVHIPQNINTRYKLLRNVLIEATSAKKRVVLLFDETHFLNSNSMRELKMLWEIEGLGRKNLFSMIMFLKPTNRFDQILGTNEIGKRILITKMQKPTPSEIFEIAKCFKLNFKDETARSEFLKATRFLPLAVRYIARNLYRNPDFKGTVTADGLHKASNDAMKEELREVKTTIRDIKLYLRQQGVEAGIGEISEVINGKGTGAKPSRIREELSKYITEKKEALAAT